MEYVEIIKALIWLSVVWSGIWFYVIHSTNEPEDTKLMNMGLYSLMFDMALLILISNLNSHNDTEFKFYIRLWCMLKAVSYVVISLVDGMVKIYVQKTGLTKTAYLMLHFGYSFIVGIIITDLWNMS
jgi:hypothetical protein